MSELRLDRINLRGDRILVELEPAETVSKGGIVMPQLSGRGTGYGTIVRAGNGCKEVKEGDRIFFGKYKGRELGSKIKTDDNREFIWMHEVDVLAVVDKI